MAGRKDGKAHRRDGGHKPGKVKRTIGLSREASARLDLHALGTGRNVGELVESLILANCRRFVLTDRGGEGEAAPAGGEAGAA